jgi:hypothetical protein
MRLDLDTPHARLMRACTLFAASVAAGSDTVLNCTDRITLAFGLPCMRMHTRVGDVLILQTERGLRIHAVGRVTKKGQEDFHRANPAPFYMVDYDEALVVARTLLPTGGRIFLVKIDTNTWSEVVS